MQHYKPAIEILMSSLLELSDSLDEEHYINQIRCFNILCKHFEMFATIISTDLDSKVSGENTKEDDWPESIND